MDKLQWMSPLQGLLNEKIQPETLFFVFWRMLFASIILWVYSMFKAQGKMTNKTNFKNTILAGVLLGIHFALFFSAIKLTRIANATFLGTLAPFFTLIIEIFILKRLFW